MLRWKSSLKPASGGGGTNGLSNNLVRAYLAEDLTEELGNANLTVRGTSASSTTGKDNNCYTYPTTGGHITDWYPSGSAWTVSCWMNADVINSATFNGTVGCHDANNHRAYWGLGNSNEAVLAVGSTYGQDAAVTYSAGTWYNFITIWDGTDAWFFVNGELRIKFAATFSGTSTDPLHLGERVFNAGASYTQWDGKQDETYIWDRALDVGSATSVGDTGGGDIAALQTLFYASFNSSGITLGDEAATTATSFATPTNIDVNIPAVSIDDILLLLCTTTNVSQPTDSPPSGWTKIREQDNSSTSGATVAAYWKRASGSASATTETWSAFYPSGESYYIWVGSYSGCTTSGSPIDTSDGNEVGFSSSVATSFTTNVTNTMVVSMAGTYNHTVTWSPSAEIVETNYNGSDWASVNGSIESTAGSKTVTATLSGNARSSIVTVALRDTAPTPLQTRTVTFSSTDLNTFTIDSDSGQEIWTDDKLNQASYSDGLRLWNGAEAVNSGAVVQGDGVAQFSSASDSATWWQSYWIRAKQDPGTGTYSDWIYLTNASGDIQVSAQPKYNNIGLTTNYSGPGTWTTHAAGFKYQVEIYSASNRP